MRYLLIGDIHSNLEAARAVLASARRRGFDRVVLLGDLVGYGANPNEVVDLVRGLELRGAIRGNHDKVVAGLESGVDFNPIALEAALINRAALTPANRDYLTSLPSGPIWVDDLFLIAHGSPRDEDEYLLGKEEAALAFAETGFPVCFFGHTHIAGAFLQEGGLVKVPAHGAEGLALSVRGETRYLINPGSVGQPRDEDPRAAYALYDADRGQICLHRVDYPIGEAQEAIRAAGLPPVLAERIARGL